MGDGQDGIGGLREDRLVVRPVVAAGVVEPHAHPPGPDRLGQVADQVATGVVLTLDGVRDGRGPEGEPVVVLRGEHDVAGTRRLAELGDGVEVGAG